MIVVIVPAVLAGAIRPFVGLTVALVAGAVAGERLLLRERAGLRRHSAAGRFPAKKHEVHRITVVVHFGPERFRTKEERAGRRSE